MIDDELYGLMTRDRNRSFVASDEQGREYDCFVPQERESKDAFDHFTNLPEPVKSPQSQDKNYQQ